jgi:CDP-6-deoxy-D-xylo-4-hexulose-3-dehydrase
MKYRAIGDLAATEFVMKNVFWVGVYPGLNAPMLNYVSDTLHRFVKGPH